MKDRNLAIDYIRVLACLLVIVIHSPMAGIGTSSFIMASCSLIGMPCVCLFFMVSGYLLLPTKESMFSFLHKRMNRILWPTLFWTVFYLLVAYFSTGNYASQPWLKTILSIPFTRQGNGFLWFMYTLVGLYLLAPILSAWLSTATKKEVQLILALWGVSLLYPLLKQVLYLTEDTYGILYYFTGYAGYFLLGYYIKCYRPGISFVLLAFLYLVPMLVALLGRVNKMDLLADSFSYLSIWAGMMSFALFMLFVKLFPSTTASRQRPADTSMLTRLIVCLSKCSFGIYLVHKLVLKDCLFHVGFISRYGGIAQILMTIPLTLFISWAVVWLLSFLPFADYIVGFSSRKGE